MSYICRMTIKGGGYLGLFGDMHRATISDLGLEEVDVNGTGDARVGGVGGLAGGNHDGNITRSYSAGTVAGVTRVGGLVGVNSGLIACCYSTSTVAALAAESALQASGPGPQEEGRSHA